MGLTIHYGLKYKGSSAKKAQQLIEAIRNRAMDLPFEEVDDLVHLRGEECSYVPGDKDDPNLWLKVQAGAHVTTPSGRGDGSNYFLTVQPLELIVVSLWPGEGCEEANFGLCRYLKTVPHPKWQEAVDLWLSCGNSQEVSESHATECYPPIRTKKGSGWHWGSFCKTQYASEKSVEHFIRCHYLVIRMLDFCKEFGILDDVNDESGSHDKEDSFWHTRDLKALAEEVGEWNEMIAGFAGALSDRFGSENIVAPIKNHGDYEHLEARAKHAGLDLAKGDGMITEAGS